MEYWVILLLCVLLIVAILILLKIYLKLSCGKCTSDARLNGKVAIVTGANTGVGFETAMEFARRGARVILACRDEQKGNEAKAKILQETGNPNVVCIHLDFASLASVRCFVDVILRKESKVHILVNNAAGYALGGRKTSDGIVEELQTNYLGPFLLTNLLLPTLKGSAPSRIINVSSPFYIAGTIDFDHFNEEGHYRAIPMYNHTKLCMMIFTYELSEQLKGTGVVANSLHPGVVDTNMFRNVGVFLKVIHFFCKPFFKSPKEGAQTSVHLAVSPDCESINGAFFMDCKRSWVSRRVTDRDRSRKLWTLSQGLVKFTPGLTEIP